MRTFGTKALEIRKDVRLAGIDTGTTEFHGGVFGEEISYLGPQVLVEIKTETALQVFNFVLGFELADFLLHQRHFLAQRLQFGSGILCDDNVCA